MVMQCSCWAARGLPAKGQAVVDELDLHEACHACIRVRRSFQLSFALILVAGTQRPKMVWALEGCSPTLVLVIAATAAEIA